MSTVEEAIADAVVARLNTVPTRFFDEFAALGNISFNIPTQRALVNDGRVEFWVHNDTLEIRFLERGCQLVAALHFRRGEYT